MFKYAKTLLAILSLASMVFFISCQEQEPVSTNDGQKNLSKVTTFVMPPGASFVSASLEIYSWSWAGATHNVDVHSVTADWTCPSWNDIAASFDPTVITSFDMSGIGAHWESVDISATVQAWLSGGTNYGLMLKNQDAYAGADQLGQFLSNDYILDPTLRPFLKIVTTAGTIEVEPSYDTYISSINPDLTFCTEEKLYIGYVDLGTGLAEKRPLIRFDIQTQNEVCETAYGFGGSIATCFLNLSPISGSNWGWTNLVTPGYVGDWPLYAGAAQCDISKGTLVGTVHVSYVAGTLDIDYDLLPGFTLGETHVWVGNTYLPVKNGVYQTAPGKFNYNGMDPVHITGLTGNKYVAAHAGVCWNE